MTPLLTPAAAAFSPHLASSRRPRTARSASLSRSAPSARRRSPTPGGCPGALLAGWSSGSRRRRRGHAVPRGNQRSDAERHEKSRSSRKRSCPPRLARTRTHARGRRPGSSSGPRAPRTGRWKPSEAAGGTRATTPSPCAARAPPGRCSRDDANRPSGPPARIRPRGARRPEPAGRRRGFSRACAGRARCAAFSSPDRT